MYTDPLFSVADRVVVVTGAARGNGRAIAQGFSERGAVVYGVDIDFVGSDAPSSQCVLCDVCDEASRVGLFDRLRDEVGRLDVLVNNAGVSLDAADPYALEPLTQTFEVNTVAPLRLARMAVNLMTGGKGAIINITSLGAELGFPENPSYQASKAALRQLTRAMAVDFVDRDVRVNNVCPGYLRTRMTKASFGDPVLKSARDNRMILGRWGEPADLVGACVFLASDAASYITGTDVHVDGGWTGKGL